MTLLTVIGEDIKKHKRRFLPGTHPDAAEVGRILAVPVSVDNVDEEDRQLILSTLPRDTRAVYLSELDKGLSGSKVYRLVYTINNRRSKPFVLKLGAVDKIEAEAKRTETLAAPFIEIEEPVVRLGAKRGALIQNFAGLGDRTELQSLRLHARMSEDAGDTIHALFTKRLANWYFPKDRKDKPVRLGTLFRRYITKGEKHGPLYPDRWTDLRSWVEETTGAEWRSMPPAVKAAAKRTVRSPSTIVHGDFHAQNILVDNKGESWPIDFAWTEDHSSPLVDLVMLECSLKFLGFPRRSDLRELFRIEQELARAYRPKVKTGRIPYCVEIRNVLNAVLALRAVAEEQFAFPFEAYAASLFLMTYALATHPQLNRPFVLASLQILCGSMRS